MKDLLLVWLLLPKSAGGSAEGLWIAAGCTAGNTFNSQSLCCAEAQARVSLDINIQDLRNAPDGMFVDPEWHF